MSDDMTTGTLGDAGLIDHSAETHAYDGAVATEQPAEPAAEQPNPMAHWLMIVENIAAGFRHLGSLGPAHTPLAGFARLIEADLAAIRAAL